MLTINPVNNQITGPAFTYDASGNVMTEPSPLSASYTYDGEECNTGYTGSASAATYTCDASHMRVKKVMTGTGAVTTVSIRSGGQVIAEYDNGAAVTSPTREYLYGNNLLAIVTGSTGGSGGTIIYQHRDHLSPRLYTDVNGNCVGDQGAYPFGELWYSNNDTNCTNSNSTSWIFTSYERDQESGNDYALARSYANSQGRFLAPDPLEGVVGDPQSWNRYAYVENDPINLSDPSGQGFWEDLGFAIADIFLAYFAPEALGPAMDAEEGVSSTVLIPAWWYQAIIDGEMVWVAWYGKGRPPEGSVPANPDGTMPTSAGSGGSPTQGTGGDNGAGRQGPSTPTDPDPSPTAGGGSGPVWQQANPNNATEVLLTGIVYNETSILRARGTGPGSAANLHKARVAIAEIALRLRRARTTNHSGA